MSLLKCPKCGNMVSDKAVACPKCGLRVSDMIAVPGSSKQPDADKSSIEGSKPKNEGISSYKDDKAASHSYRDDNREKNNLPYVLLGAAILLCVASIIFFFIRKGNSSPGVSDAASATNTVTSGTSSQMDEVQDYDPMGRHRYVCPITIGSQKLNLVLELDFDNLNGTTNWGNGQLPLRFTMNVSKPDYCPVEIIEYNPQVNTIKNSVLMGNTTCEIDCSVHKDGTITGKGRSWNGTTFSFKGNEE